MYCKWCGAQNDHDAVFCSTCGKQVTGAGPTVAPPSAGEVDLTDSAATVEPPSTGEVDLNRPASAVDAPATGEVGAAAATVEPTPSAGAGGFGSSPPGDVTSDAAGSRGVVPLVLAGVVVLAMIVGGLIFLTSGGDDGDGESEATPESVAEPVVEPLDEPDQPVESPPPTEDEPPATTESEAAADPEDSGTEADASTTTSTTTTSTTTTTASPIADDGLVFGGLLPETGNLAFLGPPAVAGLELAVQEINEAGGVLGNPVEFRGGDSGDNGDVANATVDRLLGDDVDVFVGALSSGVSLTVIDKITQADRILFSPANTGRQFTNYDDDGLYFRTATTDEHQGSALAQLVANDRNASATVIVRDDGYGRSLRDFAVPDLEAAGVATTVVTYDGGSANFGSVIDQAVAADSDAIVIIGFGETAQILMGLIDRGQGPAQKNVYGVDGNMGNALAAAFDDPSVLAGMRGTLPGADVFDRSGFVDRLLDVDGSLVDLSYSAETYDAVIVTALAAEVARTSDAVALAAEINAVTREGTRCTTFSECRDLIREGVDIDYDGVSGRLEFSDVGEPTEGEVFVLAFDASGQVVIADTVIGR